MHAAQDTDRIEDATFTFVAVMQLGRPLVRGYLLFAASGHGFGTGVPPATLHTVRRQVD
jgi:hypothetical protein